MENTYGIGVKNRYELFLNEEEDPLEILKAQEAERERKKELKQQEKENRSKGAPPVTPKGKPVPVPKKGVKEAQQVKPQEPPAPKKEENNKARSQKPTAERIVKFNYTPKEITQDVEERKNKRNREERSGPPPINEFREREPRGDGGEPRRGGRGGGIGGGRGGRGRGRGRGGAGSGFDNRGKREFDRQSGSDKSGVKHVDKKEGAGSHNWGTIKDDMEEQFNNTILSDENPDWVERTEEPTEPVEAPPKTEDQATGEVTEDGDAKPPGEDEPRQMTLDEWKREQEKNRAVPQYNLRKAGEGEDTTQWKKTYILKKKETEEQEETDEEYDDDFVRRGRQKQLVDIEINFTDSRRGRGRGRGGRGGGLRGARTPRPDRTERERGPRINTKGKNQSAPKVDDENDFPSLQTA